MRENFMSGLMRRVWFVPALYSIRMKNAVALRSLDPIDRQKARMAKTHKNQDD